MKFKHECVLVCVLLYVTCLHLSYYFFCTVRKRTESSDCFLFFTCLFLSLLSIGCHSTSLLMAMT